MKKSRKKLKPESDPRPKAIVILGPTSSGKSELAVKLAKTFGGEIISADSRQIYKGLDISSSKVPGTWERRGRKRFFVYKGVLHHMISLVSPRKQYSAGKFKKKAKRAIEDILSRGKVPIIAGGTGFYIDALIHDLDFPQVKPQKQLRKELESLSTGQLVLRLKALDPRRANEIDTKNRRRLIRAVEIVILTKSQVPPLEHKHKNDPYNALKIGIKLPDEEIKKRIDKVVEDRIASGVVDEIKQTHKRGVSWNRINSLGLEYRYIADYIKGSITLNEMKESMKKEYWRYAKRQMTWFRRDDSIVWVDSPEKAFPIVRDFLSRGDATLPAQSKT